MSLVLIKGSDNVAISLMTNPEFTPITCHISFGKNVNTHAHRTDMFQQPSRKMIHKESN